MFFSDDILLRHGRFATIWLAANNLKISRREFASVDIPRTCEDIIKYICHRAPPTRRGESRPRWSLYLSSKLMHGVVRVHKKQTEYLWIDLTAVMNNFKLSLLRVLENIDLYPQPIEELPELLPKGRKRKAPPDPKMPKLPKVPNLMTVTLDDPTADFGQFRCGTPITELADFRSESPAFVWPSPYRTSPLQLHQSPPELITMQELPLMEKEDIGDDLPPLDDVTFLDFMKDIQVEPPIEPIEDFPEIPKESPPKISELPTNGIESPAKSLGSGPSPAASVPSPLQPDEGLPPQKDLIAPPVPQRPEIATSPPEQVEFSQLVLDPDVVPPRKQRKKRRYLLIDSVTRLPDVQMRQNLLNCYSHCRVGNEDERKEYTLERLREVYARIPPETTFRTTAKWDFVKTRYPDGERAIHGKFKERCIANKLQNLLKRHQKMPSFVPDTESDTFVESNEGSIFDDSAEKSIEATSPIQEEFERVRAQTISQTEFIESRDPSRLKDSTSEIAITSIEAPIEDILPQREPLPRLQEERSPLRKELPSEEPVTSIRRTATPSTPLKRKQPRVQVQASPSPPMNGGPLGDSTSSDNSAQRRRMKGRYLPLFTPSSPSTTFSSTPPKVQKPSFDEVEALIMEKENELPIGERLTFRKVCPEDLYSKFDAAAMFSAVLSLHKEHHVFLEQLPPHTLQTIIYSEIFFDSPNRFQYAFHF